jgi:hypothetical protein
MNVNNKVQFEIKYIGRVPESVADEGQGKFTGKLREELVDVDSWDVQPHVALANLGWSPQARVDFLREYGPLETQVLHWFGKGQNYIEYHDRTFSLETGTWVEEQNVLRLAWRGDNRTLGAIGRTMDFRSTLDKDKDDTWRLEVVGLERYICLLFIKDRSEGKTGICENPDCPSPYFIKNRSDQLFCKHSCAVAVSNRKLRERQRSRKRPRDPNSRP